MPLGLLSDLAPDLDLGVSGGVSQRIAQGRERHGSEALPASLGIQHAGNDPCRPAVGEHGPARIEAFDNVVDLAGFPGAGLPGHQKTFGFEPGPAAKAAQMAAEDLREGSLDLGSPFERVVPQAIFAGSFDNFLNDEGIGHD